jgi:hypothetical protein
MRSFVVCLCVGAAACTAVTDFGGPGVGGVAVFDAAGAGGNGGSGANGGVGGGTNDAAMAVDATSEIDAARDAGRFCRVDNDCADGDRCTVDTCVNSFCVQVPRICDDGVDCTMDRCDEGKGCVYEPNHLVCRDDNPCTTDKCVGAISSADRDGCMNTPIDGCIPCTVDEDCPSRCVPCSGPGIPAQSRLCVGHCSRNVCERMCGLCAPVCSLP